MLKKENHLKLRMRNRVLILLISIFIFLIAFGAVAYRNERTPDIFTDEIIYTRLGVRVAGEGTLVWDGGEPFTVHPPLYFIIEGLYFYLIGDPQLPIFSAGDVFSVVHQARNLNAIFAGLTALVLFWFGKRVHSKKLGILISVLFLLDPFGVRINRRAMLETLSALLALTGMALYAGEWGYREAQDRVSFPWLIKIISPREIFVGLFIGLSMLTKELSFTFLSVIVSHGMYESIRSVLSSAGETSLNPVWAKSIRGLRHAMVISIISLLTYSIYPIWILLSGEWAGFYEEKSLGLKRLLGFVQITGWNRPGFSIFDYLQQRLIDYGSSYLLITIGVIATVAIVIWGQKNRSGRLLAIWGIIFYPFFIFLALVGSGNDQFFYLLLITALILTGYLFIALLGNLATFVNSKYGREIIWIHNITSPMNFVVVAALIFSVMPFNLYRWWTLFGSGVDNGYAQLTDYIQENIPVGTPINASGDPIKFRYFLPDYPIYALATSEEAIHSGVDYFVLTPKDVLFGYGVIKPDLAAWIQNIGTPSFAFEGDSYGIILLYKVDDSSLNRPNTNGNILNVTEGRDRNGPSHWRTFEPAKGGFILMFILILAFWIITLSLFVVANVYCCQKSRYSTTNSENSARITDRNDPTLFTT